MSNQADKLTVEALAKTIKVNQSLITRAQEILTDSLVPDGISDEEAISQLLELLDGPRQRAIERVTKEALDLARDYMEKIQ